MNVISVGLLDALDEAALYQLLGDSWFAQCRTVQGEGYYLASAEEIGKREFHALLPMLQEDLSRPYDCNYIARITTTIQNFSAWDIPPVVVAALAIRHGVVATNAVRGEQAVVDGNGAKS